MSNNIVRYNRVHDNGSGCIKCQEQGVVTGSTGILLSSGPGNQAYGNLVYNNTKGIVVDYGCHNCQVVNNTVFHNTKVISQGVFSGQAEPAAGIQLAPGTSNIISGAVIRNNIVFGHAVNGIYVNSAHVSGPVVDHNLCDFPAAGCSVSGDPLFIDPPNNMGLKAGSPAIDAGILIAGLTFDFDGTAWPQGNAPDIGALEYSPLGPVDSTPPIVGIVSPIDGATIPRH